MAVILTSHSQIHTNALRIWLVSIYGNGAGGVRVQHMSPYNTRELDAPSPRFAGLMRPAQGQRYVLSIVLQLKKYSALQLQYSQNNRLKLMSLIKIEVCVIPDTTPESL